MKGKKEPDWVKNEENITEKIQAIEDSKNNFESECKSHFRHHSGNFSSYWNRFSNCCTTAWMRAPSERIFDLYRYRWQKNMTGLIQWARRESNLELKIRLLMIQILIRHEGKCQVDLENSISKKNKVNYRTSGGLLETPRRSNVFIRSATLYFKYTVRLNSNIQNRPQKSIAFILNHFLNRIDRSKIKLWSKVTGFIGSEGTSNSDAD